jgi:DNA mismatch repair ATPase MutL
MSALGQSQKLSMLARSRNGLMLLDVRKLHFRYFFVHLLHELNDEVHEFVLQHLFRMKIRYEERDIIALSTVNPLSRSI